MTRLTSALLRHLSPRGTLRSSPPPELLCTSRALLKKMEIRPIVGDKVEVRGIDWVSGRGVVHDIQPRRVVLNEPAVANVDVALVMLALDQPPFDPSQATRFILAAQATNLPVAVLLNKIELVSPDVALDTAARLEAWGVRAHILSVHNMVGLEAPLAEVAGKTAVVFGPSGVGKSSLINALRLAYAQERDLLLSPEREGGGGGGEEDRARAASVNDVDDVEVDEALIEAARPAHVQSGRGEWGPDVVDFNDDEEEDVDEGGAEEEDGEPRCGEGASQHGHRGHDHASTSSTMITRLRTGTVGRLTGRGRHTTRTATLVDMPRGGFLADTPGFSQPSLATVKATELADLFPETAMIREKYGDCTFADCSHRHEPNCPIQKVDWERYDVYVELRAEAEEREEAEIEKQRGKREREGKVKVRAGKGGERRQEVKLVAKKHRRVNRRTVNQELDAFAGGGLGDMKASGEDA